MIAARSVPELRWLASRLSAGSFPAVGNGGHGAKSATALAGQRHTDWGSAPAAAEGILRTTEIRSPVRNRGMLRRSPAAVLAERRGSMVQYRDH
jgi:hypothetical protein